MKGISTANSVNAASFFNNNWDSYKRLININLFHHSELILPAKELLKSINEPFTLLELGCGDGETSYELIKDTQIDFYIGIDAAKDLIENARDTLAELKFDKSLICGDLLKILSNLSTYPEREHTIDVIYAGLTIHHLSLEEKKQFLDLCTQLLKPGGILIMNDIILPESQSRDDFLKDMRRRFVDINSEIRRTELGSKIRQEDMDALYWHVKEFDYPESISTFKKIQQSSTKWASLEIPLKIDKTLACMIWRLKNK